jgi:hypothetical protein
VILPGAKLLRREDRVEAGIIHDLGPNNLLQELATALKERYRPVGLSETIVWLMWFGVKVGDLKV